LYNWHTVGTNKLCPTDWHIPTDAEWTTLENYLINNAYNYDGTTTGNKFAKALASDTGWVPDSGIGTVGNTDYPAKINATGFTALPSGFLSHGGNFEVFGVIGGWWSSTRYNNISAYYRYLASNFYNDVREDFFAESGFAVRCLKDSNNTSQVAADRIVENNIYPNPANDRLLINNGESSETFVIIYNLQGKQVFNRQIVTRYIDISDLTKGVYSVKIIESGNIFMDKLIKD
jgi:uncharacterized protein (TIGR02145 family)